MRGILFAANKGFEFQPTTESKIDGATYFSSTAQHYNTSGGSIYYKLNQDVLQEFACSGLIKDKNSVGIVNLTTLEVAPNKNIWLDLVSQSL